MIEGHAVERFDGGVDVHFAEGVTHDAERGADGLAVGRGQGDEGMRRTIRRNRADELGLDADFGLQQRLDSCTDVGCAGKNRICKRHP